MTWWYDFWFEGRRHRDSTKTSNRHDAEQIESNRKRRLALSAAGVRGAALRAGLNYGLVAGGRTFHTMRHTMATLLADLVDAERIRMQVRGHKRHSTTQRYTHLRPGHQVPALERLFGVVAIADVVTKPGLRAVPRRASA
jgi:integrase